MNKKIKALLAGMAGGFIGNGVLGAIFSSSLLRNFLYDPEIQSKLFLEVTPQRNVPVSVAGLVLLSAFHGSLYSVLSPSIPGKTWLKKGLFWGLVIWLLYWVTQEWFIYHTLLKEPFALNLLELAVLLLGSLTEGVVIARILKK